MSCSDWWWRRWWVGWSGVTQVWRGCSPDNATAAKCCWNLIRMGVLLLIITTIFLLLQGRYGLELYLNLPLLTSAAWNFDSIYFDFFLKRILLRVRFMKEDEKSSDIVSRCESGLVFLGFLIFFWGLGNNNWSAAVTPLMPRTLGDGCKNTQRLSDCSRLSLMALVVFIHWRTNKEKMSAVSC